MPASYFKVMVNSNKAGSSKVTSPFGIKLLSTQKLKTHRGALQSKTVATSIADALKELTDPKEQTEEELLVQNVYTSPSFRSSQRLAERLLKPRYENLV